MFWRNLGKHLQPDAPFCWLSTFLTIIPQQFKKFLDIRIGMNIIWKRSVFVFLIVDTIKNALEHFDVQEHFLPLGQHI
jgi:hypothetical protein